MEGREGPSYLSDSLLSYCFCLSFCDKVGAKLKSCNFEFFLHITFICVRRSVLGDSVSILVRRFLLLASCLAFISCVKRIAGGFRHDSVSCLPYPCCILILKIAFDD